MSSINLSIVIGVQNAQANLPSIMRALRPEAHQDVEIIVCHTSADPDVATLIGTANDRIRIIRSPEGSLIPHLWRDGIRAARGTRVATTTAHCIPANTWVEALLTADLEQSAVVGGTIENSPDSDAKGAAIFLQRYGTLAPPQKKREVRDPAADNAVYRRSDLLRHSDLLERGFWEPSFDSRFRAEGLRLVLDPTLQVIHRNCYQAHKYLAQRLTHGFEFGLTRACALPRHRRPLLLLAAPAVFPLLLGRIIRNALPKPALRRQLAKAWFWLPVFLLAWVAGESFGYLIGLSRR